MSDQDIRTERREGRIEFLTESGYWDQSRGFKLTIGFIFVALLFCMLHLRDVRVENFDLDTEAPSYAVAQLDFDYFDKEATALAQQEALRDVGWLYLIDSSRIEELRRDFKHELREQGPWRVMLEEMSFEDIYDAVSSLFEACSQALFTDSKTFIKLQKYGLDVDHIYVLDGVNDQENLRILPHIWAMIAQDAFSNKSLPESAKKFAVEYLEDYAWRFEVDVASQRQLRDQIFAQVPQKSIRIKEGTRIIDKGERVRDRHLQMMKEMKRALKEKKQLTKPVPILASLLLAILLVGLPGMFLRAYYSEIFASNKRLLLLLSIVVITFGLSKLIEFFVVDATAAGIDVIDSLVLSPLVALSCLPLFPLSIVVLISLLATLVMSLSLPVAGSSFIFLNFVGLLVILSSKTDIHHRRTIFVLCAKVFIATSLTLLLLVVVSEKLWNFAFINDMVFLAICMMVVSTLVVILQPALENVFKIMTELTLMDYLDPGRELLRRLSIEAPGTYQHSLLVAHLSEVAASSIGARSLFCRVSSFYHDIGKLAFPHYFVENQQGVNVHQLLTPQESAQVIIAHVSEGVMMARKAGLPEPFVDIIKEHHGTSLVYYFYRKAKDLCKPDAEVYERDFRYCGPRPRSKEAAIIMLADCLEAASRSVEGLNEDSAMQLMENIVKHELSDGQLDNCPLSLQELYTVKRVLVKTLVAASHSRVKYPKRESDDS